MKKNESIFLIKKIKIKTLNNISRRHKKAVLDEGTPPHKKIKKKRLEQGEREREREKSVHHCPRTLSSGEIVKNHLYT